MTKNLDDRNRDLQISLYGLDHLFASPVINPTCIWPSTCIGRSLSTEGMGRQPLAMSSFGWYSHMSKTIILQRSISFTFLHMQTKFYPQLSHWILLLKSPFPWAATEYATCFVKILELLRLRGRRSVLSNIATFLCWKSTLACSMSEVSEILGRLGLSEYVDVFIAEGFDTWDILTDTTESDL